ncbi:MAG: nitrilase [Amycolatopsis sp.]|nr:nitrilase [Amycolatopsis sp.]
MFPEVFVPGYPYWIECFPRLEQVAANAQYTRASVEVPGPEIDRVRAACASGGVQVAPNFAHRASAAA